MNRPAIALFCLLEMASVSACLAAEDPSIEPGQWKVTSDTRMNGRTMPQGVKAHCYTPEQAGSVIKTFGPNSDTVNSTCAPAVFETTEKTMKWRLQCKGQLDIDVTGDFNFDSRTHYTATVSSKGWMAGALMSDVKTEITGERIGGCPQ